MIKLKSLIKETLNKWGGFSIKDKLNKIATVSIWKTPPSEFHARIDFPDATVYVSAKDHEGFRYAYNREELYPFIKKELEKRGFDGNGIEKAKTLLSTSAWKDPLEMMSQSEYDPEHHLNQSQFLQKLQKIQGDVKYRLNHPEEFDDK
jgi:hypothetical protein